MTQTNARIEHANITVSDPDATAAVLCQLFDWKIRWEGPSLAGGRTVHVGNDADYLAVYTPPALKQEQAPGNNYDHAGGLNHIGVVVDDLEKVESRVKKAGFDTFNHADYAPGRRFYFHNADGIEFEVVSYCQGT